MPKVPGIPVEEQEVAAMYFAMSNTASLGFDTLKDLRVKYYNADSLIQEETGASLAEEKADWLKECKKSKPGDYVSTEWEKVKVNYIF